MRFPVATVVPDKAEGTDVLIEADTQSKLGSRFVLDGGVVIRQGKRTVKADHIEYDTATAMLTAQGHLVAEGGENQEEIHASHGEINLKAQTGRFYEVTGSVGMKRRGPRVVYTTDSPFLFSGRMVVKTGPQAYDVYDGTVTSCQLPHPDWVLSSAKFSVSRDRASARNSVFRIRNVPVLYLPFVTHAVRGESRQSGFLIPVLEVGSSVKGTVVGDEFYVALNRSMDLSVGAAYFSKRGFSQMALFRYKGRGDDFATVHYTGVLDRRTESANQGGEDFTAQVRKDFTDHTRVVADVEYLSSYVYRQAFTDTFNQAVSSDVVSTVYATHEAGGVDASVRADRYQGLKRIGTGTQTGQQVRIFHAPSLDLSSAEHRIVATGAEWSFEGSAAGLKRVQPDFVSSGIVERLDLHPQLAYPFSAGGWRVRPMIGFRDTFYSRSLRQSTDPLNAVTIEDTRSLNRADVEGQVEVRAPVLERTFETGVMSRLFKRPVRHTVEPEVTYRIVSGVSDFSRTLRFDDLDVVSDTNEVEYGVTQRLFLKPAKEQPCGSAQVEEGALGELEPETRERSIEGTSGQEPIAIGGGSGSGSAGTGYRAGNETGSRQPPCRTREFLSWRLTQKHFFDPTFGGAEVLGRRNILDSTLNLSGIAFLTEPREISPLISRLRVRASEQLDVEWDFDLDVAARKFTANNIFVDAHRGNVFGGLSFARLNAPGRAEIEGVSLMLSDFSQMRMLLGYGGPAKGGFGIAGNAGIDLNFATLQYGTLQTSYNWNCCGVSVEYRKLDLGSVRNEPAYRFNFTLANVGTVGNLRRAQRLF